MVYNIKSVLIVENVGQKCIQILNEHGINVTQKLSLTEKELINEIPVSTFINYWLSPATPFKWN